MTLRAFLFLGGFLFTSGWLYATPDTLTDATRFVRLRYENDFFTATDRYYTQGIKLEIVHPWFRKSLLTRVLVIQKNPKLIQHGISIEQNCFTPRSIRFSSPRPDERPFAAVAFISQYARMMDAEKKQQIETQLDVGVIGPCALCEEEQKGLHRMLDNIQPLGWENQLSTDFVINYSISYERAYVREKYVDAVWVAQARLGSLYTDATTLGTMRLGKIIPRYETQSSSKKFHAWFFLTSGIRAVLYNATLQGGLFAGKDTYALPSSAVTRMVWLGNTGISIQWGKFQLDYFYSLVTAEFSQGQNHSWGGIALRTRW